MKKNKYKTVGFKKPMAVKRHKNLFTDDEAFDHFLEVVEDVCWRIILVAVVAMVIAAKW